MEVGRDGFGLCCFVMRRIGIATMFRRGGSTTLGQGPLEKEVIVCCHDRHHEAQAYSTTTTTAKPPCHHGHNTVLGTDMLVSLS